MRAAGAVVVAVGLTWWAPEARAQANDCGLEPPAIAASAPAVPRKPREIAWPSGASLPAPVRRVRAPSSLGFEPVGNGAVGGALAGKTVYVSAGHGWTWRDAAQAWRTQRGNTHDLVEDFISTEAVSHYLIHYLRNMGAYVVPVRESDWSPLVSVIDDADATAFTSEGVTLGDEPVGYGVLPAPITGATNPFRAGTSKVFDASGGGQVRWTFDVAEAGAYNVYVGWVQDPSRASDAHYVVHHAGGDSHFRVDQRRHGGTWVLLGRFHFDAGASPERGAVALLADSAEPGATLSADVARVGGGVGVIDRGGGANGRPMFENNARYYAQLAGAPSTVYDYSSDDGSDDVGTRSRFAAWDHEDGEDAVYLAWHTNAPSPARGTSSFVYGPSSYGPISEFSGVAGSVELVTAVHDEIVADARAGWQPDWQDRGLHAAYFGEVNPNHNPEMPAALFEIAFHDTAEDADALRDPRFRALAARAMAQGVAKYFAARDGAALTLAPEPPTAPRLIGAGERALELAWSPPAANLAGGDEPTGYRVYLSRDGRGFDDGTDVTGTSMMLDAPADGGAIYARVTATNAGGESFPARVVGARPGASGRAQVLVIGGFDRLDRSMLIAEDLSGYALATIERGLIERINDGSHLARYGAALDAARVSFDSADDAGSVDLGDYALVIWQLGEESIADDPLDAAERAAIETYLAGGGSLVLTGSELAWALGAQGNVEDAMYLSEVLHVRYAADDAGTYEVVAEDGELFAGLATLSFGDRGIGGYDADFPDVLEPGDGAAIALRYQGGTGGGAAIIWRDGDAARLLFLGFPFETLTGEAQRAEVMARILAGFGLEADPFVDDDPEDEVTGGCCDSGSHGSGTWALALLVLALVTRRHFA
ncbi:MAG TPA: N-acetylmuramoyl-L-alanine amidase [Kofleriaceae bacterium]|nr:N-acetylmuramoyl-L-alanine amidase [Kofleriaceae bacterium]